MDLFSGKTGRPVTAAAAAEPPPILTADISLLQVNTWMGVPSVEAAMAIDAPVLLAYLLAPG